MTGVGAVDALQVLRRCGFGGRRIFGDGGNTVTLHYRRQWRGVADVVLVYAEDDAEAYRAHDALDETDPFDLAARGDLHEEVLGTVVDVVAAVLRWPVPEGWRGHFSP